MVTAGCTLPVPQQLRNTRGYSKFSFRLQLATPQTQLPVRHQQTVKPKVHLCPRHPHSYTLCSHLSSPSSPAVSLSNPTHSRTQTRALKILLRNSGIRSASISSTRPMSTRSMPRQHSGPLQASLHLGIDFGTSGARGTVIGSDGEVIVEARATYAESAAPIDRASIWEAALASIFSQLPSDVRSSLSSIAIDGTSSTALLINTTTRAAHPTTPALMYYDACTNALPAIKAIAPPDHTVLSEASTLAKLVSWHQAGLLDGATSADDDSTSASGATSSEYVLMHQADWLGCLLHGRVGVSDYNNALKLGYDPETEAYPDWLVSQPYASALPQTVLAPGDLVACISPEASDRFQLSKSTVVYAGTTDSIAAFLAANVTQVGQAVTSLGSTLAIKLLSDTRVDKSDNGIYSHRLGDKWLVGGASNVGGAFLRTMFTDEEMTLLSNRIDPKVSSGLQYYPLMKPGERFPVNDPTMQPCLEPRPEDDSLFLHGILESIARIEAQGYKLLEELGCPPVTEVCTAGGGSKNEKWMEMRALELKVPVRASDNVEASYGAALLARSGYNKQHAGAPQ